jgi:ABC-type multidrug transport system ATPase subunit
MTQETQSTSGGTKGPTNKAAMLRVLWAQGETAVPLVEPTIELGRSANNHVRIQSDAVGDVHARLVREGASYRFHQLDSEHPTLLRGATVVDHVLQDGDRLEIAPGTEHAVTLIFAATQSVVIGDLASTDGTSENEAALAGKIWRLDLPANGSLMMGRDPGSDLVLPSLQVALHNARLDLKDGAATITSLDSRAGVFVNGARVKTKTLTIGDVVRIGPYKIVYRGDTLEHQDDSMAVRLDAERVTRFIGKKQLLDGISFCAMPGEVLAIAGTSGAGKSTLLYALTGIVEPTHGRVMVNGADLYESFEALQPLLGYVPQREILPLQLPVERALHYVAQLRLPTDVAPEEMEQRIEEVMRSLDLHQRRDVPIGSLSGGQQKRASIAAELIARPGLFYLDEPTSGLDPGLARRVSEIMRDMAERNSTVVVISHDVEGLQNADKIVFLATGGKLAFIGAPKEALTYFDVDDLADIYPRIESEDSSLWQEKFKESAHYDTHVTQTAEGGGQAVGSGNSVAVAHPAHAVAHPSRRGASAWRQFTVSFLRYAESMIRDRRNLALLLVQAPIIALFLALVAKAADFQPPPAAAITQAAVFGIPAAKLAPVLAVMLAATATWFGAINSARELVKEMPIFLRDRLSGLRVAPYLLAKVLVLAALCIVQTTVLLAIVALKVDLPSSGVIMWGPLELWITLNLAAFAALGIGLLISASVGNPDQAQSLVPIVLIPQLIFIGGPQSGAAGQFLSYLTVTHWASEAMKISAHIPYQTNAGGYAGSDLLYHWLALGVMGTVLITLAGVQLVRRKGG